MAEHSIRLSHLVTQSDINNFSRLNIVNRSIISYDRFRLLCAKIAASFPGNMTTGL